MAKARGFPAHSAPRSSRDNVVLSERPVQAKGPVGPPVYCDPSAAWRSTLRRTSFGGDATGAPYAECLCALWLSSCTPIFYSGAFPANGPSFLAKIGSTTRSACARPTRDEHDSKVQRRLPPLLPMNEFRGIRGGGNCRGSAWSARFVRSGRRRSLGAGTETGTERRFRCVRIHLVCPSLPDQPGSSGQPCPGRAHVN